MKALNTEKAPAAIGPYSQAIEVNGLVFTSGQLPIDPSTGQFPEGGIKEQTRQSLLNIKAILNSEGLDMGNVVKTTVLLNDIKDFAPMNAVYAEVFESAAKEAGVAPAYPARVCYQVAALPMGALVEIDCIAGK